MMDRPETTVDGIAVSSSDDEPAKVTAVRRKSSDEACNALSKASPFGQMLDAVRREATTMQLWNEEMHRDLPKKWEKHGDLIILPQTAFQHPNWRLMGRRLWQLVADSLKAERLGRKRRIADDEFRSPHIDLMYGRDGWVEHVDNGVRYQYDVTKCMFSIGNISEKLRIATFDCRHEVIVDLFAGIGYFTLPYLVHAHAKHVVAIDWNPDAIEALVRNLDVNKVAGRCTVIEGDCRRVSPQGQADRVNLGLIPTARPFWLTGCKAVKATGGVLHIHETLTDSKMTEGKKAQAKMAEGKVKSPVEKTQKLEQMKNRTASLVSVSEEDEQPPTTADSHERRPANGKQTGNAPSQTKNDAKSRAVDGTGKNKKAMCVTTSLPAGMAAPGRSITYSGGETNPSTNGSMAISGNGIAAHDKKNMNEKEDKDAQATIARTETAIDDQHGKSNAQNDAIPMPVDIIDSTDFDSEATVSLTFHLPTKATSDRHDGSAIDAKKEQCEKGPAKTEDNKQCTVSETNAKSDVPTANGIVRRKKSKSPKILNGHLIAAEESQSPTLETKTAGISLNDNGTGAATDPEAVPGDHPSTSAVTAEPDGEVQQSATRKMTRSASIVEEMESRPLPNPRVDRDFRAEKWPLLDQSYRDFAINCATSCTRFLNNIHYERGRIWTCTVLRIGKVKSYAPHVDHVVLDLLCKPEEEARAFAADVNDSVA